MAYSSFEELEVWQRACRVAVRVYEVLQSCKDYGLKDQMTRSAVSIGSNIAEGAERDSESGIYQVSSCRKRLCSRTANTGIYREQSQNNP